MTVLDTDIVTLLSYGKTDKLQARIAAVEEGEVLAVTVITRMEVLQGRFANIRNAARAVGKRMAHAAVGRFGKPSGPTRTVCQTVLPPCRLRDSEPLY